MSNIKSEFEKYFKENHADSFYSVDAALEMRGDDYIDFHAADLWALWQHQQSKIDKLQANFDQHDQWLGQRNRDVQELNDIIAKHAAEKNELQKRVDAVKELAQTLWEKSNDKHKQGKVWESKALGECADEILDELEQALKGGESCQ